MTGTIDCPAQQFNVRDLVWVLKPPRGRGITNLVHQWVGPAKITQNAGYDNWEVIREANKERMIVHCSLLESSRCPSDFVGHVADRILRELEEKDNDEAAGTDAHEGAQAGNTRQDIISYHRRSAVTPELDSQVWPVRKRDQQQLAG
ncbi:unnamed protein product [Phytophthora fragariaefolia]|uniref:Unnamed protein product n=1 Tax=Phytophthora fragariaefolia TaxID=1490495 RepID=A0A9W7CZY4_9STRA|nr:unnamed protein product [Phytophthora fragariaefolia]